MTQPSRRSNRFSLRSKQLGQLLVESGQVQQEAVDQALATQESSGGMLGRILREMGSCDEIAIAGALLKQVQVTDINCDELLLSPDLVQAVPHDLCLSKRLCPVEKLGNLLCIAMANPLDRPAINAVEEATRLKVKPFKATWPKIKELIDRSYTEENLNAAPTDAGGMQLEEPQLENVELDASPDAPTLQLDNEPTLELPSEEASPSLEIADEAPVAEAEEIEEAAPAEPNIPGFDGLGVVEAEVIETDARGLTRRKKPEGEVAAEPAPVKKVKVAKVNVDLDAFDASSPSETVQGDEPDDMEEISQGAPAAASAGSAPVKAVKLEKVQDAYFYQDGHGPSKGASRDGDLLNLIHTIPVAKVLAQSESEYGKEAAAPRPAATGKATSAPVPTEPVTVVPISEAEFKRLTTDMDLDPVGEWQWKFAAAGPVAVDEYEVEAV